MPTLAIKAKRPAHLQTLLCFEAATPGATPPRRSCLGEEGFAQKSKTFF